MSKANLNRVKPGELELKEKVVKLEGEKEDLQKQLEATGVPK